MTETKKYPLGHRDGAFPLCGRRRRTANRPTVTLPQQGSHDIHGCTDHCYLKLYRHNELVELKNLEASHRDEALPLGGHWEATRLLHRPTATLPNSPSHRIFSICTHHCYLIVYRHNELVKTETIHESQRWMRYHGDRGPRHTDRWSYSTSSTLGSSPSVPTIVI